MLSGQKKHRFSIQFQFFLFSVQKMQFLMKLLHETTCITWGVFKSFLQCLLRRGSEAVQCEIQSEVVLSTSSDSFIVTYQLLLRLANVGHPHFKQIGTVV